MPPGKGAGYTVATRINANIVRFDPDVRQAKSYQGHLKHTKENKRLYALRKETIERLFADAKEEARHAIGPISEDWRKYFCRRCLFMNLKKLATWLWKSGGSKRSMVIILDQRANPATFSLPNWH